jgi:molecular chaperone DnaJ
MPRDYYEILGVERNASQEEIKRAFRQVGKKYHPDVSTEPDAQAKFQEANEAYQVLSDPDRRRSYDRFGHAGVNFGAGGFSDFAGGFEDIFEEFMGAFTGRARSGGARRRARQGRDLRYDLQLTFEQAVFGDDVEIDLSRWEICPECEGSGAEPGHDPITCPECNGSGQVRNMRQTFLGSMVTVSDCPRCGGKGQVIETPCHNCDGKARVRETRTLAVNIPPGVDDGTQIRLSGEGEPGELGGPPGNLYVVLSVEAHQFFKRRGYDILLEINVNVAQAALGENIVVPTVEGEQTIKVEPGTQTGQILKLKNMGFPKLRANGTNAGRGDQLCIVNVSIPTRLTPDQRALFENLRDTLDTEVIASADSGKSILDRVVNFFSGE